MDAGAGVVDEDVDPAEPLERRVEDAGHVLRDGDVGGREGGGRPSPVSAWLTALAALGVAADQHDVGSGVGEGLGEAGPETAGPAGDDGHSAVEVEPVHDAHVSPAHAGPHDGLDGGRVVLRGGQRRLDVLQAVVAGDHGVEVHPSGRGQLDGGGPGVGVPERAGDDQLAVLDVRERQLHRVAAHPDQDDPSGAGHRGDGVPGGPGVAGALQQHVGLDAGLGERGPARRRRSAARAARPAAGDGGSRR